MDILEELENKNQELNKCHAIIQLQQGRISDLAEKIQHLEKLLMYTPTIIEPNKES